MRRAGVLIEGGVYHVSNRVASGEAVFADPEESIRFIGQIRKVKARDGWTVFAYCVISNHTHLRSEPHRRRFREEGCTTSSAGSAAG